ncbi:MAG TPA: amino acid adenylation domain-containing protein, partial [Polyangia bacterium]|nr:amino acid adenylation domain-containing protein [Polyangia bacterium]
MMLTPEEQRARLAQLLQEKVRKPKQEPLSFAQERMWFLDQWSPGSAVFSMPVAVRLRGELRREALERSLQEMVRRHEVLRTTFTSVDGRPLQVIAPALAVSLPFEDLAAQAPGASDAERERVAQERMAALVRQPFDLTQGPLLRAMLFRLAPAEHLLLLNMHHIIADGWSLGVMVQELASFYRARCEGRPAELPPLGLQYAEYAAWQREWLKSETLVAQLDWWRARLDPHAVLELPADKPRPAVLGTAGAREIIYLPAALTDAAKSFAQREGKTLFVVLLAVFKALLQRYTGKSDLTVGTIVAGRNRAELEPMIGLFFNTLALRTDVSGRPTFRALVERVHETSLGAFEHQDVPFERLVDALKPTRLSSHLPIFQVMFLLQNAPLPPLAVPGLTMDARPVETGTTKHDLTFIAVDVPGGLRLTAEYSTDLFEAATLQRLLGHFQVLLAGALAEPDRPIDELPLLTAKERRQILHDWDGPRADYPRDACLHSLIEAQAERTPEAVALVAFDEGGESLTYRELDERANQLAHHLRALGVGPEDRVGVCLERSLEMVIALLGTLKAGAAYVPLDPSYPRERLVWMLEDARPPVILTAEKLLAGLPGGGEPGGRVLCLDTGWPEVARHPRTRPAPAATADHLAYVIFTSGSTGRPKGAMNVHRALCNRLLWMQDAYGLGPGDVVLQKTPFSFDVSVWEFFWPLLVGARLVIARPGGHQDPAYLVRLIAAAEVTTLHFVPSMLQVFLQEPGLERCAALRRVICSGEALPSELKAQCLAKLPWAGLHNLYGPTEAAVDVTYFDCQPGSGEDLRAEPPSVFPSVSPSVSIGRPVANTQIRILDARLEPVPVGVPGELYIGGVQVGRGYTGRPELTAERFVPDPFTGEPGGRLYRTGDLVRWRPDGDIEYLGRTDFQVKIRGLRIELGEIETALLQVPGVRQVVVVGREDVPGDRRLVAYVVSDGDGAAAESGGLRAALQERLPEYMVPSLFLFLRELPLMPSGKIDRKALPAPSRADIVQAAQAAGPRVYLAPRNDVERQIAGIYTELLRVSEIGAHDDFFALGGHSLLATQVVSRLRSTLAVEMPVRVLFEAPTVAALAERVTRWTEESRGPAEGDQPPLPRVVPRTGELPLSFAQQRLWFLDQLEPGNPFYNLPIAVRMVGKLDVAALERSLAEVVRRHEALRTTFVGHEGRPVQVLAPELDLRLDLVDLQDQPPELREARARERAQEEVQRPFDLARGPLLRACLLRLGAEDHVLLVTLHHIVADGWSLGVLVREFGALYSAFSSGQPSPLAPLVLQYVDYAAWQREWLAGAVLERQLAYWKGQLGGRLPVLELPTDYPGPGARPPVQTFRGAQHVFTLPRPLAQALDGFSRRQGATLFMTLLAAFQALLQRYSGQDDIVVGTPIAGRTRAELEGLIGLFVNTLALRTDLGGNPTFRTLLGRVREVTLGAYAHQELPFEKLVEELEPERDLSRSPLFQVLFALQNMPIPALAPAGLTITPVELDAGIAKFDLSLYLQETAAGLRGVLEYNTDLFEAATIARMAGHFESLLRGIAADPDQPLAELPLLTAAEREQLLVTWNQTRSEAPADACIHTLFEAQVRRTPDRVALVDGTRELGYAELNRRANQLAHTLRALGVRAEAPVGICMRRTAEMVIGLLGILKAGATYVPLDPAYPRERLAFVLEDARVQLLLTQSQLVERLPDHGARVLCLDADGERIAQASDEDPVGVAAPGQLAYLIYTSGSTGRPKGVAIEHRQAVAFLHWAGSVFSPAMLAGTLAGTSINFDLSVFELFLPLASGSAVILADTVLDLPRLPTAAAERVTLINTVPSAVAELLRAEAMPAGVRNVNLAGEPLSTALVKRLYECPGIERVHDLYGPSETTTYSTYTLRRADAPATIGRPIDGTRVYVLDRRLMPVPLGVPGELYIGGAGVARGYLGRPDLTAERFLPDPFGDVPGARLYRTGDLVRWRPGGELEYLGRRDFQVKVRGFRIELGEIESALGQHPSVRQAVVVAREDRPGDKRLVGYLVASPAGIGAAPSIAELREFLKQRLPEYMVPAAFVFLDQLPLTPSGKIDRRALPAPEAAAPTSEHVAPRTPVEESLAGIWAEVLGRSQPHGSAGAEGAGGIGVEDNFFELGGHSLLATQIISRVRTALQVELPVRALFEVPTVAGMARAIEALRKTAAAPQAPSLRAVRSGEDLPLSFAQQRLWFLDQLQPGDPSYNLLSAVRVTGPLDAALLQRCLEEIVGRHEVLRTTFAMRDGQPIQVIAPAQTVPITVLDLRDASGPEQESRVRALAEEEARHPFDLARGPLLRATMLYLAPEVHVLLLGMHHIAADGWSNGVLLRELAALYQAFRRGQPSPLPPLPLQYADHALWQRSWLSGEVLAAQVAYWRQQLTGAPPVLELPTDRPRPVARSFRGATETLQLPRDLSEALRALGRREGATPFMVLLAAFQALLYRYSGQDDISVGVSVAGRTHVETERLIGFFANTLVLRSRLAGDQTVQALLAQVREATLGAYAHQDVPFEKLVEELQPARNLSYSPLFQVMVGMLPPAEPLASPGFVLEPIDVDRATAKFDLTLAWVDRPEGFTGSLTYNTDIFDAATIVRLLGYFQVLLTAAVESPGRRLDELPLLSNEDLRRSRDHWFAPLRAYEETDRCVQELFEAHAARTPEAIAVSSEHGQLTYRELNRRANQLGRHLRSLGVGPEVPVGIFLEGSSEMVLCMLGILKAGGAYVPIDPLFPAERMRYMLEDSGAPVLLSKSSMRDRIPAIGIPVLYVDAAAERLAAYDGGDFPSGATIASKVYIIYTSGSTGRPKGVVIEHRQLLNYLHAVVERVGLEDCREFAMLQPLAVDSCKTVVYPALCRGGTLHVLPRDRASDPHVVAAYFRRHTIDVLKIAPSHLAALVNAAPSRDLLPRRVLVIGGEASHWEWVRTLAAMAPEIRLFNHYGPTEATVGMLTYPIVPDAVPPGGSVVPLGRPLPNTEAFILNAAMEPVPIGVPGEIYIGGQCLARGYLNEPRLTADRFVPSPFSDVPGSRLYRTGDMAKWLPGGFVEYLGRTDHQIKIRGFRIEPGEIAAVLKQHAGVQEALVMARDDGTGDKRLVAYVVPRPGAGPRPVEAQADTATTAPAGGEAIEVSPVVLRNFLKDRVPDYMVPAAVMLLEALPLTPHGKVDLGALPAPGVEIDERNGLVAPRTPREAELAAIWQTVLRREPIGVTDDFFEVGGHSLLATQVVARIRTAFQIELPVRALFEAPTIAGLAERIDEALRAGERAATPPLVPMPRTEALPLSFAQQRLWFLDQLEPGSPFYNIPAALRLRGTLDVQALGQSFAALVARHESLRTIFASGLTTRDGQPVQRVVPALSPRIEPLDLTGIPEAEREARALAIAQEEALRPFDLAHGPLLRVSLLRLGADDHVLLVVLHHIVSDGWSTGILIRDLGALYQAFSQKQPAPLAPLPIQYADFALWQRTWLAGPVLERQLAYWREQLGGRLPVLELPTDRPRPPVQTHHGAQHRFTLPAGLSQSLEALGHEHGVTLFMTLLAAFQTLLHRYTGQEDLIVGTPSAGRTRAETEDLIGFFVNTLALRTRLRRGMTFRDLLAEVREVTLAAHAHQEVPFERVVEALEPERDLSRPPIFQVMFGLQNLPAQALALPGLVLTPVEFEGRVAKFDLSLFLQEGPEGLRATLEYNTDLFDAATAARMAGHFRVLLEGLAARPESTLAELPLLDTAERHRLLAEWAQGAALAPADACMHELFEAQAARTPEAAALIDGTRTLSYVELDQHASRLARELRALGVGPETTVGICLERSWRMVVGLLGILKAGGTYVPLDPAYPEERLALIMADAQIQALVTEQRSRDRLPATAARILYLEEDLAALQHARTDEPVRRVSPQGLAYLIYTSGSTGRPKGVAIEHRQAVAFLSWAQGVFEPAVLAGTLAATSIAFDLSIFELFLPLARGGTVILARTVLDLPELPAAERVTLVNTVPSAMSELVRAGQVPA